LQTDLIEAKAFEVAEAIATLRRVTTDAQNRVRDIRDE